MANSSEGKGRAAGLTATFSSTTPPALQHAAGAPTTIRALSKLEERGATIKERAIAHYKNFEDRWTAKEALRIWQRHLAQAGLQPVSKGVDRTIMPEGVMRMASQNVLARTHQRLARINRIKAHMGNSIARNLGPPSPRIAFNDAAPAERPIRKQTLKR